MATLSLRSLAASCNIPLPISVRQHILNFGSVQSSSLKEQLLLMRAQCAPWEVLQAGGVDLDSKDMAVHAALVPTADGGGEILYFGGYHVHDTHVFDVQTAVISDITEADSPETNIFCSGHAFLASGRLLVAGGQLPPPGETPDEVEEEDEHEHGGMEGGGERACWLYNPPGRSWKKVKSLHRDPADSPNSGGRWYPTLVTLADGQVLAASGHPDVREVFPNKQNQRHNNNTPERYSPVSDTWTLMADETTAPNPDRDEYQRIHLLPDGSVFFSTLVKGNCRLYDAQAGTFLPNPVVAAQGDSIYHHGSDTTSVLLPLLPGDNYTPRVLVCGGVQPLRITLAAGGFVWETAGMRDWGDQTPPVRHHLCSVILPDGKVFISGGTETDGDDEERQAGCVRAGEVFDPGIDWDTNTYLDVEGGGSWETVPAAEVGRHYHSVALLMPDGLVWTAGSNGGGGARETRIEIFRPLYSGHSNRPEITESPASLVYGQTFSVRTPQAASVRRVALIRNGSVTHAFNGDQRYVALNFSHAGGDLLSVTAPPWGGVAPPGHYMLWIVDEDDRPCRRAKFVHLAAISVRITAAACNVPQPISLKQDIFGFNGNQTGSLLAQLLLMQKNCLT